MNRGISKLLTTIATSSQAKAEAFLKKYNMPRPNGLEDTIAKMYIAVKRNGDKAMYDLAAIHPDRDLIVKAYLVRTGQISKPSDAVKSNAMDTRKPLEISYEACGCSADGGENPNKTFLQREVKISNVMIYGALGLIALTLFVKVIKS